MVSVLYAVIAPTLASRSDKIPPIAAPREPPTSGTQDTNDVNRDADMPTSCQGDPVSWLHSPSTHQGNAASQIFARGNRRVAQRRGKRYGYQAKDVRIEWERRREEKESENRKQLEWKGNERIQEKWGGRGSRRKGGALGAEGNMMVGGALGS